MRRPFVLLASAVLSTVALTAGYVLATATHTPAHQSEMIEPTELDPIYEGNTVTWDEVTRLQKQGLAKYVLLFSDEKGDYVRVFDTENAMIRWECVRTTPDPSTCK